MENHNFIENQLVILTKQTIDIFLQQNNPAELIALYTFYYYTAKWQKTNQIKCTTSYVSTGLHWSTDKVRKVKKQLLEFGLIEDVKTFGERNKITGHYIKMNYVFKNETVEHLKDCTIENEKKQEAENKDHTPKNTEGGKNYTLENEGINALSGFKLNALSENIKTKKKERKPTSYDEILSTIQDNDLKELYFEYIKMRKLIKAPLTDRALKMLINKVNELEPINIERQKKLLETAIINNWKSVYPLKDNLNNKAIENKNKGFCMPSADEIDNLDDLEFYK